MLVALIGSPTRTNVALVQAWLDLGVRARVLSPAQASAQLRPGDAALGRLDVLPTLDGVEPGLEVLDALERRGVLVRNRRPALLAAHDKLLTEARLAAARLPRPWTAHLAPGAPRPGLPFPCVLKPRFGSWGQDVFLCRDAEELDSVLAVVGERSWWLRHGALVQEAVAPARSDLRVVVAGGRVAAAARRVAAAGEWRTNVTLGGRVVPAALPHAAAELAVRAARALGIDFAGVDLLPLEDSWLVLEVNGAVDFDRRYALPGLDPYAAVLEGLGLGGTGLRGSARTGTLGDARKEAAMTKTVHGKPARPGDEIVVTGHSVGDAPRTALILEVLGEPGHERFRVRWEDGHESIFFPGEDAIVRRPRRRRAAATA
ncbi:MAG TPA: DUF1918 domain-containing protein [Gaiellaceae bacterium]|nr:DUF1918 domain-containing protein [Gaiellaceae bacterium]